ncbi:MAG: pseudouridine-5'-phosphate glycosidase [Alphaproteobacteria bacterium]|nr:pseudouridine-5'-phosphate glycosidase [Alphaproteobacteria bacterium]
MQRRDDELIDLAMEVRAALADGRPVVALESSIVAQGMPWPHNLETALAVERIVRAEGAVPATIAVVDGRIRVGLDEDTLRRLSRARDAHKASRRDLAALVAARATAGTTVAATMWIAARCGIAIFATGGIGGVHRGAEETFDVSADLIELGRTPVAVVSAGAKSILDIGKTLEVLETQGVPVLGYRTDTFPAFFTRDSGHKVDRRFDSPQALAEVIATQRRLGLQSGILIANPISEADALAADDIEARIAAAVRDAEAAGVARKDLTPFLLARVNDLSDGASLRANIALVKNNAALAAQIAVAHAALAEP